jgi:hypothetical protein
MNINLKRRLQISRTPATEGLIYEVLSDDGHYKLQVKLSVITRKWLKIISFISAWRIEFQSSNNSVETLAHANTLKVKLSSPAGASNGFVREAPFSKLNKEIVQDEFGRALGWINYGFKRDYLCLANSREVGFIVRLPMKDLPLALSPSKAYMTDRFELSHYLEPEFGGRLICGWSRQKVWPQRAIS